jgi:hypothetical protein
MTNGQGFGSSMMVCVLCVQAGKIARCSSATLEQLVAG